MQKMQRFRSTSRAPEPTIDPRHLSVARRASLEELRSNNSSPLLSVRGVYVRSRPTSPSPTFENWPYRPLPDPPQRAGNRDYMPLQGAHLATSFASFDVRDKKPIPGTPHPRGRRRVLSSASVDDAFVGTSRIAGPPPAYTHDYRGSARESTDDDDEVVYMKDRRKTIMIEIEREQMARLRDAAASLYFKVELAGGHIAGSIYEEPLACYAPHREPSVQHTVKFSATDTIAMFRRESQDLRSPSSEREFGPGNRSENNYAGSFFDHLDDEEQRLEEQEEPKKPKSGDNWAKAMKGLFKRLSNSRKGSLVTDDRSSMRSSAEGVPSSMRSSAEGVLPAPEKIKAASASLFNVRLGAAPPRTAGSKSVRAPSIKSTASRNVLVKNRKAKKVNQMSTPQTYALTSSARAVEGRMRPPSGSSSDYTDASRPMSWEWPDDLASESEVLLEAMEIIRRQKENNWVYTPAHGGREVRGKGNGYVQVEQRAYY
ncbi:hypothetical protein HYPSUDRAFT_65609 [Hypholoma sublateritium FD-334 SS-4]|uniref:Uncharacterized protein n=1 Tax=Hypholoma sublateritium (strain FD-334 SS-4) TaxID=945553 RepID=A0A0D2PYA9_HYPSF|nr:hypothetical protein HYPSUDRAFT_65609 [Hypholoma sublateritium FD-334 SS-4]